MPGPTARHAHRCPADESLLVSLRYLSKRTPRVTPAETQAAAVAYDRARMALWVLIANRLGVRGVAERESPAPSAGQGNPYRTPAEGPTARANAELRAWVRRRDGGFRLSTQLAEGPDELALLAEAKRQRERAAAGLLGLAASFARAHRGAGQGLGRGLVLVAPGADALQGALEHVLRGLDRYDPDYRTAAGRSCKASTFVSWYAFKGVQDERMRAADARLTTTAIAHWAAVEDAERDLRQRLGREPTWDEVVDECGLAAANAAAGVTRLMRSALDGPARLADMDDLRAEREQPCPLPLPDEEVERAEVRREVDAAAPPGSRVRRVVEAAADGDLAAAARYAGGRSWVRSDLEGAREIIGEREEDEDFAPVRVPRSPFKPLRLERVVPTVSAPRVQEQAEDGPTLSGVMLL